MGVPVRPILLIDCPDGRPMIEFIFRKTILDTPIFRPSVRGFLEEKLILRRPCPHQP